MPSGAGEVLRVMVVEDDAATLGRFCEVLCADSRFSLVGTAATQRDAIRRLEQDCPDVLLVDLGLPDGHGIEVIRHAARACPQCDIMVITVFGDEGNVVSSIEAGAAGYVLKDASAEALCGGILELRAGGAPMSPGIARLVLKRMRSGPPAGGADDEPPPQERLTTREVEVLAALSRGYSYAEIADRLGISLHTVTGYIKSSYRKLSVHTGAAAVARAARLGLLQRPPPDPSRRS